MNHRNHLSITTALAFTLSASSIVYANADPSSAAEQSQPQAIELAFVTHLDMEMPEQDVFIQRQPGSQQVYRVTVGDNNMQAPLYAAAENIPHDPFSAAANGPHPKGKQLNMKLGDWLRQHGRGSYVCNNGEGVLDTRFSGLVPNGVYTMWYAFMALPPTEPFNGTLDLPLGARDGSQSVFSADADGNAVYQRRFKPCLEMSNQWTTAMLAIAWHSDGKTYGGEPGAFGANAHIPLFVMLPKRSGL